MIRIKIDILSLFFTSYLHLDDVFSFQKCFISYSSFMIGLILPFQKMKKISRLNEIESDDFIRFRAYNVTIKLDELNAGIERG